MLQFKVRSADETAIMFTCPRSWEEPGGGLATLRCCVCSSDNTSGYAADTLFVRSNCSAVRYSSNRHGGKSRSRASSLLRFTIVLSSILGPGTGSLSQVVRVLFCCESSTPRHQSKWLPPLALWIVGTSGRWNCWFDHDWFDRSNL